MEPQLEKKLYSAEKVLLDKYINSDSTTYIGDNTVEMVFADLLRRNIVVLVNADKEAAGGVMPVETSVDGIPVTIEYGKTELISCVNNSNTE